MAMQAMTEDELLDALTEGFDTTPVAAQCAPLQSSAVSSMQNAFYVTWDSS